MLPGSNPVAINQRVNFRHAADCNSALPPAENAHLHQWPPLTSPPIAAVCADNPGLIIARRLGAEVTQGSAVSEMSQASWLQRHEAAERIHVTGKWF